MEDQSTILIEKRVISLLKKAKEHPRQTYSEILERIINSYLKIKERDQYDKFIHEVQKPKMNELWNNKEDEIWDKI
ncbi:MAG: hypothetical protein NUV46_01080 [Nanoarchaeota archaeon]|nr:hypothetical protein [Nanoarchaeota archaeon]